MWIGEGGHFQFNVSALSLCITGIELLLVFFAVWSIWQEFGLNSKAPCRILSWYQLHAIISVSSSLAEWSCFFNFIRISWLLTHDNKRVWFDAFLSEDWLGLSFKMNLITVVWENADTFVICFASNVFHPLSPSVYLICFDHFWQALNCLTMLSSVGPSGMSLVLLLRYFDT